MQKHIAFNIRQQIFSTSIILNNVKCCLNYVYRPKWTPEA